MLLSGSSALPSSQDLYASSTSNATERFGSEAAAAEWLLNDALARYEHLFGNVVNPWDDPLNGYRISPRTGQPEQIPRFRIAHGMSGTAEFETMDISLVTTDIETRHPEESDSDVFLSDGNVLYAATRNRLQILDASSPGSLDVLWQLELDESRDYNALHLDGNRLIAIAHNGSPNGYTGSASGPSQDDSVAVLILDVSDPTAPQVLQNLRFDGARYVDSEMVGDQLYLVQSTGSFLPPPLQIPLEGNASAKTAASDMHASVELASVTATHRYETVEEYVARFMSTDLDSLVPQLYTREGFANDGETHVGSIVSLEDILTPGAYSERRLLTVSVIDTGSGASPSVATQAMIASVPSAKFLAEGDLYLATPHRADDGTWTSTLHRFDLSSGFPEREACRVLPGTVANQDWMDRNGSQLRVVTTATNDSSSVVILDAESLEVQASLEGIAPDRQIHSVGFDEDVVYLSAGGNLHTLLVVDTSNPSSLEIVADNFLLGRVEGLQPVGGGYWIGLLRQIGGSFQETVDVFDFRDPTNPDVVSSGGFNVEMNRISHRYFSEERLFVLTEHDTSSSNGSLRDRLWLWRVSDTNELQFLGHALQDDTLLQTLLIDETLYSLSHGMVLANDLTNPGTRDAEVHLKVPHLHYSRPFSTSLDRTPTFAWDGVSSVHHYEIRVDNLTTGESDVIRNAGITNNSFTATTPLDPGTYRWTVRALSEGGTPSEWATPRTFTITLELAATIVGPEGSVQGATPTFDWNRVPGADRYDIWVNNLTTGENGVIRQIVPRDELIPPMELPDGKYIWTVRALNEDGEGGAWAPHHTLTIARLATPEGLQTRLDVPGGSPRFEWEPVDGADHYDLWVNNLSTGQIGVIRNPTITGSSFTPDEPLPGGRYIWTVQARHADGSRSPWAPHETFTVLAFPAPELLGPVGEHAGGSVTFSWTAIPGAERYDLWVNNLSTGESGVIRNASIQENQFTPQSPLDHGKYIWTVRAISEVGGLGEWAEHRTFNVIGDLEAPTITGPIGGTFDGRPSFHWTPVPGAVRYDIWVNNRTTGQSGVIRDASVTEAHYQPDFSLEPGNYIWTVRAFDANGSPGQWAAHEVFTIRPSAAPELIAPVGLQSGGWFTFRWTPVPGADRYDLWVNNRTTGESGVIRDASIRVSNFTPTGSLPAGNYIWTVRAIAKDGSVAQWAEHRTFTTDYSLAPVPHGPGETLSADTVRFSWSPVQGAVKYEMMIRLGKLDMPGVQGYRVIDGTSVEFSGGTALAASSRFQEFILPAEWQIEFTPGESYSWAVRGISENDAPGPWSEFQEFTMDVPALLSASAFSELVLDAADTKPDSPFSASAADAVMRHWPMTDWWN